jgi:post-segregation antitoxin (ccd killing protein)
MADDAKSPAIDPALLEQARAQGIDVETLIDRTLRRELAARRAPSDAERARAMAETLVAEYNERFDRDGPWIEAWRRWE